MSNNRLTVTAAIAVLAATLSLYSVLLGNGWMAAAIGAITTVAAAGTLTRLGTVPAAIAATAAVLLAFVWPLGHEGWPGRAAALVALALTASSATGARLPRAFAALATYAGMLALYLNVVFASARSLARVIPTVASLTSLSRMPSLASAQFHYAPPIQPNRAVELVAAAGVGITAILVDLLAARLRQPAIAGLPLLLLFSVPMASSLKGFGIYQTLTFGVSISAYLALLSADRRQRLRMWGRLVTIRRIAAADEASAAPDTRELAASGRRVGLAAVAVAMAVPVVLVGSSPHDPFRRTNDGTGLPGFGTASSQVSPLIAQVGSQLSLSEPRQVLTYTTDAADPTQQYFQEYVLNYNPHTNDWLTVAGTITEVKHPQLPDAVPGLAVGTQASLAYTAMSVDHFAADTPLPVPYAPLAISDNEHARLSEVAGSLMVLDSKAQDNLRYEVTSTEPEPSKTELSAGAAIPGSITRAYGGYTGPDEAALTRIAYQHVNGAVTPLQYAVDLQNWLDSGRFTYTTKPDLPHTNHWVLDFLTTDRRGDCEQFAPAFAILARLVGIPSRVVVGYTGGSRLPDGEWQVTTADAHAWPELYFPGAGWIRFEPTPSAFGDQGTASVPPYTQGVLPGLKTGPGALPSQGTTSGRSGKGRAALGTKLRNPGLNSAGSGAAAGGSGFPVGIVVAIVIFLLIAWPAAGRWLTSRRRWLTASDDAGKAHAAWRELCDYLTDYGLAGPPSESPRATATRLAASAAASPQARAAVTRIGAAEERALYSQTPAPGTGLSADVARVRKALAAHCTWPLRLRARLLPASTLTIARGGIQSLNRALSWIDSPLPSLRRRTRPRARRALSTR